MLIASGSYAGNTGVAVPQTCTGFGSVEPDVVIVKTPGQFAVIWIRPMTSGLVKNLSGGTAYESVGGPSPSAGGFSVSGSDARLNVTGNTYRWVAFAGNGSGDLGLFNYTGNATDDQAITAAGLTGTGHFGLVAGNTLQAPVVKFRPQTGDASQQTDAIENTNRIQAFTSGGLQIGTHNSVNDTGVAYCGFVIKNNTLFHAFAAAYSGTGVQHDETDSGAGFTPQHAWVKSLTGSAAVFSDRHPVHTGNQSGKWGNTGTDTNSIVALIPNGMTVGTNTGANGASRTYGAAIFRDTSSLGGGGGGVAPSLMIQQSHEGA